MCILGLLFKSQGEKMPRTNENVKSKNHTHATKDASNYDAFHHDPLEILILTANSLPQLTLGANYT